MPSRLTRPRKLLRIDLLGWLCFLALLIANVCNNSAPAGSPGADSGGVPCTSDIAPPGGDDQVNVIDLLAVINDWGSCSKDPPPVCDPNGQWFNNVGMNYNCALGLFHYTIAGWEFSQFNNTLSVEPLGSGNLIFMTGPATDCESGNSFSVTGVDPNNCTVTFTLSGTFTNEDQFSGTFTVSFSGGGCFGCTTQSYNIIASRQ